jgi:hypothetical protein
MPFGLLIGLINMNQANDKAIKEIGRIGGRDTERQNVHMAQNFVVACDVMICSLDDVERVKGIEPSS